MKTMIRTTLLVASLLAGGCQALPWFVAQFSPPKKIDAVYKPPKDKKVLVLVENKPGTFGQEMFKYDLADCLGKKLVSNKVAASTISSEQVQQVSSRPGFHAMTISEVGQALGADLVLYVQIDSVSLKDNPVETIWHGRLSASVWIVDVKGQKRIWPVDLPEGMGYAATPVDLKAVENPSTNYAETVIRSLTEKMSDNIAKLLYDHTEEQSPMDLPPSEMPNSAASY